MDNLTQIAIGTTIRLTMDFESALERVTDALKAEGFGVLTEIDVKETLEKNWAWTFARTESWARATRRWLTALSRRPRKSG
jgi:uncharacterized protein (DUF302 family)